MVMNRTSAVDVSIQAVSPELMTLNFCMAGPGMVSAMAGNVQHKAANPAADIVFFNMRFPRLSKSHRVDTGFTGTDTHDLLQVEYENLAVADLAGTSRFFDGFDHLIEQGIVDGDFEFDLG